MAQEAHGMLGTVRNIHLIHPLVNCISVFVYFGCCWCMLEYSQQGVNNGKATLAWLPHTYQM